MILQSFVVMKHTLPFSGTITHFLNMCNKNVTSAVIQATQEVYIFVKINPMSLINLT